MSTAKAKARVATTTKKPTIKKPVVKQRVLQKKLAKNQDRVTKPQKHSIPWSNQYGSSK